ncbi:BspA family leucine-rich repeat surface protein [Enterococcus sp. DIV1298c]|uniref:BspA family leucine-rich repeat surface protein n=1 Tax=Enterococcus sp. DIV1298c TaxID=2815328 RepID=UPI001A9270E6|nr:BspA family leucine-rich repeat surface protein [Enterococcus sp. DIV1298c]MBO0462759.1 BspA family leucine-rich repeat surface protein [Enterococcus sp. DIV1298c]
MWRIRLVNMLSIIVLLGGVAVFPTSAQLMSNNIYEEDRYLDGNEISLFDIGETIDSMDIPKVLEEDKKLQVEDDPLWIDETLDTEEYIELPGLEQDQEEQKQVEEKEQQEQQENGTQLDDEPTKIESGLRTEVILEEVQDEGIARVLTPEARTLFSGQLGSIPWVVGSQGTLILGSGVFDEANNIGGRYAATDYFNHPMYSHAITRVQLTGPIVLRGRNGSLNMNGDIRRGFFTDLTNVTEIEGIEFLDTSELSEMAYMFANMSALTSLDVSSLDTRNVWTMHGMFENMSSVTELDVSSFDTSNLLYMARMFRGTINLTKLDMSGLDTSNVTDMRLMFADVRSITELDVSGFDTSKVTDMSFMFNYASSVTELDVSDFDTSSVTDMQLMFRNANNVTELNVSGFDTSSVVNMNHMFLNVRSITELDVSHFDTSEVRNMFGMFDGIISVTKLDVSGFNTSNVTNMSFMFMEMSTLTELDLSNFDTRNVTSMEGMFRNVSSVKELDVSGFDTSNVVTMARMFENVRNVIELDVSGFDTRNVTSMQMMFGGMSSVTELDVSGFDTRNVTNMSFMFQNVSSVQELNMSGFDTRNVTDMMVMFHNANSITKLNMSGFDTRNVTDTSFMFMGMSSLTELDLSSFDTRNATNMQAMFIGVPLEQLTLGSQFIFHLANGSPGLLPLSGSATHHPNWQNVGEGTVDEPKGSFIFTSAQLMANYDGATMADTWVWQPRIFANLTIDIEGHGTVLPDIPTSVERGEMIDIRATPEIGWRFSHWRVESGDGTIADPDQSTTNFTMGEEDAKLVAVFEELNPLITVRIPTSAVFNTTSESHHRNIVAPDYAIENKSPFAVSVDVVAPTELTNMEIIEELNVAADGKENLLINKGNIHHIDPFRLFDLETEEAKVFTFTGTAEELSEEESQITPTFNMVLRFVPNL